MQPCAFCSILFDWFSFSWLFWSSYYFHRVEFLFSFYLDVTDHYEHLFNKTQVLIKLSFREHLGKSFFYFWDYTFLISWVLSIFAHCMLSFLNFCLYFTLLIWLCNWLELAFPLVLDLAAQNRQFICCDIVQLVFMLYFYCWLP